MHAQTLPLGAIGTGQHFRARPQPRCLSLNMTASAPFADHNAGPCWQDLPEALLERIPPEAFEDSGAGLAPWLHLSGVCR